MVVWPHVITVCHLKYSPLKYLFCPAANSFIHTHTLFLLFSEWMLLLQQQAPDRPTCIFTSHFFVIFSHRSSTAHGILETFQLVSICNLAARWCRILHTAPLSPSMIFLLNLTTCAFVITCSVQQRAGLTRAIGKCWRYRLVKTHHVMSQIVGLFFCQCTEPPHTTLNKF